MRDGTPERAVAAAGARGRRTSYTAMKSSQGKPRPMQMSNTLDPTALDTAWSAKPCTPVSTQHNTQHDGVTRSTGRCAADDERVGEGEGEAPVWRR